MKKLTVVDEISIKIIVKQTMLNSVLTQREYKTRNRRILIINVQIFTGFSFNKVLCATLSAVV